jgi:hypothetical protein
VQLVGGDGEVQVVAVSRLASSARSRSRSSQLNGEPVVDALLSAVVGVEVELEAAAVVPRSRSRLVRGI